MHTSASIMTQHIPKARKNKTLSRLEHITHLNISVTVWKRYKHAFCPYHRQRTGKSHHFQQSEWKAWQYMNTSAQSSLVAQQDAAVSENTGVISMQKTSGSLYSYQISHNPLGTWRNVRRQNGMEESKCLRKWDNCVLYLTSTVVAWANRPNQNTDRSNIELK